MTYLKPGVLWGEHRSTELIAMNIKDLLINDPILKVPFIEYKEWTKSDYVSVLYQLREADNKGLNWLELERRVSNEATSYEKELVTKYGQFLFNLHDGTKDKRLANHDIEFLITYNINKQNLLENYLKEKAKENSLSIIVKKFSKGKIQINNDFITVEFMTPEEIPKNYASKEIEKLDAKYGDGPEWPQAKKTDTNNALFNETVIKYAKFMKSILKDINELNIT